VTILHSVGFRVEKVPEIRRAQTEPQYAICLVTQLHPTTCLKHGAKRELLMMLPHQQSSVKLPLLPRLSPRPSESLHAKNLRNGMEIS
jgi:hypothetical protein